MFHEKTKIFIKKIINKKIQFFFYKKFIVIKKKNQLLSKKLIIKNKDVFIIFQKINSNVKINFKKWEWEVNFECNYCQNTCLEINLNLIKINYLNNKILICNYKNDYLLALMYIFHTLDNCDFFNQKYDIFLNNKKISKINLIFNIHKNKNITIVFKEEIYYITKYIKSD